MGIAKYREPSFPNRAEPAPWSVPWEAPPSPGEEEGQVGEHSRRPCSLEVARKEERIVGYAVLVAVLMEKHTADYTAQVVAQTEEHTLDSDETAEVQKEGHNPDSTEKEAAPKEEHTAAVLAEDQTEEHNPHDLEAAQRVVHTPAVYQEEALKAAHTADFPDRNSYCYFAFAHSQV